MPTQSPHYVSPLNKMPLIYSAVKLMHAYIADHHIVCVCPPTGERERYCGERQRAEQRRCGVERQLKTAREHRGDMRWRACGHKHVKDPPTYCKSRTNILMHKLFCISFHLVAVIWLTFGKIYWVTSNIGSGARAPRMDNVEQRRERIKPTEGAANYDKSQSVGGWAVEVKD